MPRPTGRGIGMSVRGHGQIVGFPLLPIGHPCTHRAVIGPTPTLEVTMYVRRVLVSLAALLAMVLLSGCGALQQLQSQLGG